MREVCQRCSLLPPVSLSLSLFFFSVSRFLDSLSTHPSSFPRNRGFGFSATHREPLPLLDFSVRSTLFCSSLLSAPFPDTRRVSLSLSVRFSIRDSDSTRLDSTRLDSTRLDSTRFAVWRVESSRVTLARSAYHFRGLPFSAIKHTRPPSSLSLSLRRPRPTLPSWVAGSERHPSEVALFFAISCFSSPGASRVSENMTHRI